MYKSKLLRHPEYNVTWFWDSVAKFNGIANPDGVLPEKQIPIIKSELKELLDSKNANDFMDGVIDGLVTLAPLVPRQEFEYYWDSCYEQGYNYHDLAQELKTYIDTKPEDFHNYDFYSDHSTMVHTLLTVLVSDETHYEENCESVLESNLSKFIPLEEYRESYFVEVVHKYPQHTVTKEIRSYEGEDFVVFFNENGKVLKGHSYFKEPDLITD